MSRKKRMSPGAQIFWSGLFLALVIGASFCTGSAPNLDFAKSTGFGAGLKP